MGHIIYLTTSILPADFDPIAHQVSVNPAGQNFHAKMIRLLCKNDSVTVISLLSTALPMIEEKSFTHEGIAYRYIRGSKNRYLRALFTPNKIAQLIKKLGLPHDAMIVFDSLNVSLSKAAILARKKSFVKAAYAIITDAPENITGVNSTYINQIHNVVSKVDGCIALTEGLARHFGFDKKRSYICPVIPGERIKAEPKALARPYYYYGGALYEKDGALDLLKGHEYLRDQYDLVIAGHGPSSKEIEEAAKKDPTIHFLGQISPTEHIGYIQGASFLVNPRHYNKSIDELAVPSKVIEYLCYGKGPIVSVVATPLKELFPKQINWMSLDTTWVDYAKNLELSKLVQNKTNLFDALSDDVLGGAIHDFLSGRSTKVTKDFIHDFI